MIELLADKVRISGPKIDGGYSLTFEVGQYEQVKLAEILKIPQNTILKILISEKGNEEE